MPAKTTVKAKPPPRRRRAGASCSPRRPAIGGCCSNASACPSSRSRPAPTKRRWPARRRPPPRSGSPKPRPAAWPAAHPDALIIGSDQVADCDGRPIGKPGTHERAAAQLAELVGPDGRLPHRPLPARHGDGPVRQRARRRPQHVPLPVRRRDRGVPAARAPVRLRRQRSFRSARHRALRAHRERRSDGAHRPAADPAHVDAARGRRRRADASIVGNDAGASCPRAESARRDRARARASRPHDRDRARPRALRRREREAGARVPALARPDAADPGRSTSWSWATRPIRCAAGSCSPRRATGHDLGLLSDAGCPAIADPGALVVREAHREGIAVVPLVGPSSIVLALMASGMNGQGFVFHGYLPVKAAARAEAIQTIEAASARTGHAQIFIETPYRTAALIAALVATCKPATRLCVAADLTLPTESIGRSRSASGAAPTARAMPGGRRSSCCRPSCRRIAARRYAGESWM